MTNINSVRWAILGAGRIAHQFAADFRSVENAELVAVASRDAERAKEFGKQYNIPKAYSYEELYNANDVDAVYIATPHNFHFEQALACMQHGKGVLCEKPITINAQEFKKLAMTAIEKNVFLMEAIWTFFLPALQKAKEWVNAGRIGAIKIIQADFGHKMEYDPDGRLYNPMLAGGALLDLGIYPIAFSTFFTEAYPEQVKALAIIGETHIDESTSLLLQYKNTSAILHCTILNHTLNTGYLFGDEGFIKIPHFYKATSAYLHNNNHELVETFNDNRTTAGYDYEIREATRCIISGKTESDVVPHKTSNWLQEIMTDARQQTGLRYPMEK